MYLCPNVAIKPENFACVINNHGTTFLGAAKLGVNFFTPLNPNWNGSAYVSAPDALPNITSSFIAVLFGTVSSLPGDRDKGLPAGTRRFQALPLPDDSFRLRCPAWDSYGSAAVDIVTLYGKQKTSLLDAAEVDTFRDLDENLNPRIREWVVGDEIVVNLSGRGKTASCLYANAVGEWSETSNSFPFVIGDSVILSATLRMDETLSSHTDHMRDYGVNAIQIKRIRLAPPSAATTLAGEDEAPSDDSGSEVEMDELLGDDEL